MTSNVAIGIGSNLGDRDEQIRGAWRSLSTVSGVFAERISSIYETRPIGGPLGQPDFLNAVGLISTDLNPFELLNALNRIELQFGRTREIHWGPRTIDLDIIFFDDWVIRSPCLTIPHLEYTRRLFVLEPLLELMPEFTDPVNRKTVLELYRALAEQSEQSEQL